jgi:hypothetical protein
LGEEISCQHNRIWCWGNDDPDFPHTRGTVSILDSEESAGHEMEALATDILPRGLPETLRRLLPEQAGHVLDNGPMVDFDGD